MSKGGGSGRQPGARSRVDDPRDDIPLVLPAELDEVQGAIQIRSNLDCREPTGDPEENFCGKDGACRGHPRRPGQLPKAASIA